jgi:hypothetical protein
MPEVRKRMLIACLCLLAGSVEVLMDILRVAPSR